MKRALCLLALILCSCSQAPGTVTTTTRTAGPFSCDGSDTTFDFTFPISAEEDLDVILTDSNSDETTLTLTTHYTVTAAGGGTDFSSGGTVTTVAAYASGNTITLERDTVLQQDTSVPTHRLTRGVETALDRAIMAMQDIAATYYQFIDTNDVTVSAYMETLLDATSVTDFQQQAYLDLVYNVKAYGAEGDGSTDDTTSIQTAENAADDVGGVVYFPPGRYKITETVEFNDVSVRGDGAGISEIVMATETNDYILRWDEADGITVRDISVIGKTVHTDFNGLNEYKYVGILLDNCTNAAVQDCNVLNTATGIMLIDTYGSRVVDCNITSVFDVDDYGDGSNYNYCSGIRLGTPDGSHPCADILVQGCEMSKTCAGIAITDNSNRVRVYGCTATEGCENAYYASSGEHIIFMGNTSYRCAGNGVKMRGNMHAIIGNKIEKHDEAEQNSPGITATGVGAGLTSYGTTIVGNTIYDSTGRGIYLEKNTAAKFEGWSIVGNVIKDCGNEDYGDNYGQGILITQACNHGTIIGNVIENDGASSLHGMLALTGVADDTNDVNDIVIANNVLIDPNHTGMYFQYTNRITVSNNQILDVPSGGYGMYFKADGSNNQYTINGNRVDCPTGTATTAMYGDADGVLSNSMISGNEGTGNITTFAHSRCIDSNNVVLLNKPDHDRIERMLATATADMQNGDGKTTVYTVPTGRSAIVTQVVIRNPSASLAAGNDFDFGDGAAADTWKQTVDLSGMTATTDYYVVTNDDTKITVFDAGDAFGIKPATGATADATATMEVYGFEF